MKNKFLFTVFFLTLLCAVIYIKWDDYIAQNLPREITITNKDGDIIEITLSRRDEKNIYFFREEGPMLYSYEIAQLNFLSRCKVKLYPKLSLNLSSDTTRDTTRDNPGQAHLNAMLEEREDIFKRIELLKLKKKGVDYYKGQAINKDITNLYNKADSIKYKIEDLKYRYPHLK